MLTILTVVFMTTIIVLLPLMKKSVPVQQEDSKVEDIRIAFLFEETQTTTSKHMQKEVTPKSLHNGSKAVVEEGWDLRKYSMGNGHKGRRNYGKKTELEHAPWKYAKGGAKRMKGLYQELEIRAYPSMDMDAIL